MDRWLSGTELTPAALARHARGSFATAWQVQLFEYAGVDARDAALAFGPKAEHRGFDPASFADRFRVRITQYEERWDKELREHVRGEVPHFE